MPTHPDNSTLTGAKFQIDLSWKGKAAAIFSFQIVEVLELRGGIAVVRELASMCGSMAQIQSVERPSNVIALLKVDDLLDAQPLSRDADLEVHIAAWRDLNLRGVVDARARNALSAALLKMLPSLTLQVHRSIETAVEPSVELPLPNWKTILSSVLDQVEADPNQTISRGTTAEVRVAPADEFSSNECGAR